MIQAPFEIEKLWNLSAASFVAFSKTLFEWQATHNNVYKQWVELTSAGIKDPNGLTEIPFLPISFFKTHELLIGDKPDLHFESSGTTMDVVSKHWVTNPAIYEQSFRHCFDLFYGNPAEYCVLGLLPSYLERSNSSLVYMVEQLIQLSGHVQSGFYLDDFDKLNKTLKQLEASKQKTILIGVSFALIDFGDAYPQQLNNTIVMETGGMKGRRTEMIKSELHAYLKDKFGVAQIHSEYGMTELLSQAYAKKDGLFTCPPWMKVLVGEEEDPSVLKTVGRGILHVIDLANIYSCAFIATQDLCELNEDGSFSILGRIDNSDRRGCSLLVV